MKYELTDETIEVDGRTLYRIRALKNIDTSVKNGDLGSFVESESNLSQEGSCWIYGGAKVFGNAKVFDSAIIFGNAEICGNAEVYGNAMVCDNAEVFDYAWVYGNAWIYGNARVYDNAKVYGDARVSDNAQITKISDVFTVSPIGSRNATTTFYKAKDGKIFVKCGCKNTDIDTWLNMVKEAHGDNKHAKTYRLAAQIAKLQILGEEV